MADSAYCDSYMILCVCACVCVCLYTGAHNNNCYFDVQTGSRSSLIWYLPMCVILMRSLGWTSTPSLNHFPVTFSSDTSHLNTACSAAFTVRSAMLCRTSSSLSEVETSTRISTYCSVQMFVYNRQFVIFNSSHSQVENWHLIGIVQIWSANLFIAVPFSAVTVMCCV